MERGRPRPHFSTTPHKAKTSTRREVTTPIQSRRLKERLKTFTLENTYKFLHELKNAIPTLNHHFSTSSLIDSDQDEPYKNPKPPT